MKFQSNLIEIGMFISFLGILFICLFLTLKNNASAKANQPAQEYSDPVAAIATDQIKTIDPGVHCFPEKDFQQRLADWIIEHPEHHVCAIGNLKAGGYVVVTRVDPVFLNDVLPGSVRPPK